MADHTDWTRERAEYLGELDHCLDCAGSGTMLDPYVSICRSCDGHGR